MPGGEQDPGHRDAGRAGAGDDHAQCRRSPRPVSRSAFSSAASATTAVPCWSSWKTGMSSALLSRCSISKHRGARDVLEVDAAEGRREPHDGLDDLVDVGGVQADRDRVDAAELLEQHRLALHHRHRGRRADVAEAEHRGAVGDDRDRVGHPGVVAGPAPGRRRSPRRPGHARACRPARGRRVPVSATRRARSPSCRRRAGRRRGRRRRGVRPAGRSRRQASGSFAGQGEVWWVQFDAVAGGVAELQGRTGVSLRCHPGTGRAPRAPTGRHTRSEYDGPYGVGGQRAAVAGVDALGGVVAEHPPAPPSGSRGARPPA